MNSLRKQNAFINIRTITFVIAEYIFSFANFETVYTEYCQKYIQNFQVKLKL